MHPDLSLTRLTSQWWRRRKDRTASGTSAWAQEVPTGSIPVKQANIFIVYHYRFWYRSWNFFTLNSNKINAFFGYLFSQCGFHFKPRRRDVRYGTSRDSWMKLYLDHTFIHSCPIRGLHSFSMTTLRRYYPSANSGGGRWINLQSITRSNKIFTFSILQLEFLFHFNTWYPSLFAEFLAPCTQIFHWLAVVVGRPTQLRPANSKC